MTMLDNLRVGLCCVLPVMAIAIGMCAAMFVKMEQVP